MKKPMGSEQSVMLIYRLFLLNFLLLRQPAGTGTTNISIDDRIVEVENNGTLPYYEVDALRLLSQNLQSSSPQLSLSNSTQLSLSYPICSEDLYAEIKCGSPDNTTTNGSFRSVTEMSLQKLGKTFYMIFAPYTLSHSICRYLYNNSLSGPIPKQLGKLSALLKRALDDNDLHGTLPEELGNLTNLQTLYLTANNFTGTIPTTYQNLTNLAVFAVGGNYLSGPIPGYIGKWVNLAILVLIGNNFSGNLPAETFNLTNLQILRVSDVNNPGISFPKEFIPELNSLFVVVLRNCKINGSIPEYIGRWPQLSYLDLSFNNLNGSIPETFGNLTKLFLTRNMLTGLPSWITSPKKWNISRTTVDLSYNNFNVSCKNITFFGLQNVTIHPTWSFIDEMKSKKCRRKRMFILLKSKCIWDSLSNLNVSTNSNTLTEIIENFYLLIILLIFSLETIMFVLKMSFPADNSLFINSGGEDVYYGKDHYHNDTSISSFNLSPSDDWAYSYAGDYLNTDNFNASALVRNLTCEITSAKAKIDNNFRLAPVSLTYYGLCLRKGEYIVTLYFAEALSSKSEDYSTSGKRVFDIYIQGTKRGPDVNIKEIPGKEHEGKQLYFPVKINHGSLEIQLFWAGKGSIYGRALNGPLISAVSITRGRKHNFNIFIKTQDSVADFIFSVRIVYCLADNHCFLYVSQVPRKLHGWEIALIIGCCILFLLLLLAFMWRMGWIGDRELRETKVEIGERTFTLKQIIRATKKFSPKMQLGSGRSGIVYRAELPDPTVAVKKIFSHSKAVDEIGSEVYARKALDLKHENLVNLIASYSRRHLILLIYEYMEHGSLGQVLFGSNPTVQIDWQKRFIICRGIAKGLKYLHERNPPIIHRNIKANNILLDASCNPKISDFGLAKLYEEENPFIAIGAGGDLLYMSPEYATRGAMTVKVDVYSFGILLLEIVSGRNNADYRANQETVFLLDTAGNLNARGRLGDLVDPSLRTYDWDQAKIVLNLAMMCTEQSPSLRPTMSQLVAVLEGEKTLEDLSKEIAPST
ncbi:hypothetical protein POTOM_051768 [Populus tomentosa]|uniref:non-specific serine/threonine protein kinase n=1 Tax=Populus tomentosa TaxID=118781 RepID=A0A8X7Y6P9_POPTO|nr:hypothetical protein POTOM_051768 [Populus tomentosa]